MKTTFKVTKEDVIAANKACMGKGNKFSPNKWVSLTTKIVNDSYKEIKDKIND